MTDPTEALTAALAEGLCDLYYAKIAHFDLGDEYIDAPPELDVFMDLAAAQVAALTPEVRDKMLLGFAVAELPDESWDLIHERPAAIPDDLPPYGIVVWYRDKGGSMARGRGSTPLAAIRAALEVTDG